MNWAEDDLIRRGYHPDDLQAGAILDPPDPDGRGYGNVTEVKKRKGNPLATESEDTYLEVLFDSWWKFYGDHQFVLLPQYEFHPDRNFVGDRVCVEAQVVVEVDGMFGKNNSPGGHRTLTGYISDRERDSLAMVAGWYTYRIPGEWLKSASKWARAKTAINELNQILNDRRE